MMDEIGQLILGGSAPKGSSAISDSLLDSLRFVESSNNPKAVNAQSGAMGAYQHLPTTVAFLSKKYGPYDPYNEEQQRVRTRQYLGDLVESNGGNLDKALAQYGGFVTKDPSGYINKVTGGAQQAPDELGSLILGSGQVQQKQPSKIAPTDALAMAFANKVNPLYSMKATPVQEGSMAEKAVEGAKDFGKATAAFLDNTIGGVLPYGAKQVGYLFGRSIGDTPETAEKISSKMASIVDKPFGKVFGVSDDPKYKGEATSKLLQFVGDNVGKGSEFISDKTGLPKTDVEWMINTALPKIVEKGAGYASKGATELAGIVKEPTQVAGADRFAIPGEVAPSPMGGRSVGAAETMPENIARDVISRASPERQKALQNVPLEQIDIPALERQNKADKFGIELTEGQRTQDVRKLSDEWNSRAKPGYEHLQESFNQRSPKLVEGLNTIAEKAAPDIFTKDIIELGDTAIKELQLKDQARLADIDAKYKALQNAAGGQFPIDVAKLNDNINAALNKSLKSSYVPSEIRSELKPILEKGSMTFEQFEALRTNLAQEMRSNSNGNARAASAIIRQELENLPMPDNLKEIKPLADAARAAVVERNNVLKANKAYAAAVKDVRDLQELQSGVEHVGADKFIQKYIINGDKGSLKRLINELGEDSLGHQALKAGTIEELKKAAGIVNESGEFGQKSFNNAVHKKLGSKLEEVLGNMSAQDLRDLADVAAMTENIRKTGTPALSNTPLVMAQEAAKGALESAANWKIGGGIVPVGSMGRRFLQKRAEEKAIKKSLEPTSGIVKEKGKQLKDIGKD